MHWYTGNTFYDTVLTAAFAFAAFVIIGGFFAQSSYGRFSTTKLGLNLNPKLGWWLMEIPATVVFLISYLAGPHRFEPTSGCCTTPTGAGSSRSRSARRPANAAPSTCR